MADKDIQNEGDDKASAVFPAAALITRAFGHEEYSDLNICCAGRVFKVHRLEVCPKSEFFRKACDGRFKVCAVQYLE